MTLIPFPHAEGAVPILGIALRPGAGGDLELVLADLADPDDARVLVAFDVDREAEGADDAWREERTPDGRARGREAATGATIELGLAGTGAIRLTLDARGTTSWVLARGDTGPLMGPAGRRVPPDRRRWPLEALNPELARAVASSGGFAARSPAHIACEAFALSLAPPGGGAILFRPPRLGAATLDRLACRTSDGGTIDATLLVKFEASSRAIACEPALSPPEPVHPGAVDHLPLGSLTTLGIVWAARGGEPHDVVEWARRAATAQVPGGDILGPEHVLGDLPTAGAPLVETGFAAKQRDPRRPKGRPQPFAALALGCLRTPLVEGVVTPYALPALRRRRGDSAATTLEALALGAFVPHFQFELDVDEQGRLRLPWWQATPEQVPVWQRAAAMRLAFLPYHAHLLCRAVRDGLPVARPAGVHPIDLIDQPRPWQPHLMLGDEVFVVAPPAPDADGTRRVHLPGGEWVDFYRGGRFRNVRELKPDDYGPAEVPVFVRAGAVLPLLDLSTEVPWAGYYCKRRGPGERLILKLAPTEGDVCALYDVLAVARESSIFGVPRVPMLRVVHERRGTVLEVRIEGKPRPLTLLLRTFKPGRVGAGPTAREIAPLAVMSSEKQFLAGDDCWYYHPHRDETLIKTRVEEGGALVVRLEEMREFGDEA